MATKWPKERRLIGTRIPRVDGPDKSTGHARYSYDINRPGMLHALVLRSPYAHCIVESIDTKTAEGMPGVKGIQPMGVANLAGRELFYVGDEILALAADTEEHARDAIRAIKVKYKVLDALVQEQDVLKNPKQNTVGGPGNLAVGQEFTRGDVDAAFKEADAVHEGQYGMPTICHHCLEPHGLVAEWDQDGKNLTVWCSTQAVFGTAQALANHFKIPPAQVKCITHYMGGGYGSKFGPDVQGIAAAELAKKLKAPVKLMLDRAEEIIAGGNRPSAYGTVKLAGKKDGSITAFQVDCYGTPGYSGGATVNLGLLPYVYTEVPNIRRIHTIVRTNTGRARAMRAPGHPQNCALTDCPVDDLAAKLGLDPMQVRLKNLPPNQSSKDPVAWLATRETIYKAEIEIAAKMSDWKKKWHPPGQGPTKGPSKHGIGMAMHTWGGFASAQANDVTVTISRDGSVLAETSSQDLGTAQRTVNALVTAEILGLEVADVSTRIGESQYGSSSGSGGSTTLPSQAPATLQAAAAARDDLFAKIAPKLGTKAENLSIAVGKVVDKGTGKSYSWKEACAALGMNQAKGQGMWNAAEANKPENAGISSGQVGGVQIAEVWVDTETGFVRNTNIWAVQDCGLVINKLACESQVAGGVIMGVNYALFEDRIMDRVTGRQVNPDMEFYKLGGILDMPRVHVHMYDMPERGTIGIGEPPTISTAAAIGNAIFNATGVRVPFAPYSPEKVLAALMKGGKS